MTIKKPLVMGSNGKPQQLQSGDSIQVATTNTDVQTLTNGDTGADVIGTPVYISAAATFKKAKADASATSNVFGMVYDTSIANGATGQVATFGVVTASTAQWDAVTGQTGGLTPGSDYFLDPTTAGKMTTTPPSSPGQYVVNLGTAQSTTDFQLNPQIEILL